MGYLGMSTQAKRIFVTELVENIKQEILANLGHMPEAWDGIELRQYCADETEEGPLQGHHSQGKGGIV